jgi:hypothetical protein
MKSKRRRTAPTKNPASLAKQILGRLTKTATAALAEIADSVEPENAEGKPPLTIIMDMPHPPRECNPTTRREVYGSTTYIFPACTHAAEPEPEAPTKPEGSNDVQ